MSVITIQCRLVASEDTRRHLWQLMANKNTPLINELLEQVRIHPDNDPSHVERVERLKQIY